MNSFLSKRSAGFRTSCAVNLGLLCLLSLLGPAQLQAATGILVRMEGIKGDSTQSGYKDFVEASSFSFGIDHVLPQPSKSGTTESGLGLGELKECEISKVLDRASTQLAQLAVTGNSFDTIEVYFMSPSSSPESTPPPYLIVKLKTVFVKSWNVVGDGEERPKENISFWFNKIAIAYRGMKDGKEAEPVTITGWDRLRNVPWEDHGITDTSFSKPSAP